MHRIYKLNLANLNPVKFKELLVRGIIYIDIQATAAQVGDLIEFCSVLRLSHLQNYPR